MPLHQPGCAHPDRPWVKERDLDAVESYQSMDEWVANGDYIPCHEAVAMMNEKTGVEHIHPRDMQIMLSALWLLIIVLIIGSYWFFFERKGRDWA